MKNTVKVLAIIALLAVTGFSMAGCGDPGGGLIGGDDTAISIAAIAGVTAPVQGATPVTAITANAQYTGTVAWSGTPATFAYATEYTATITLTAKSGYTLQGVSAGFFTVAGALSVNNAANSGVVTATFPPTANDPGLLTLTGTIMISPNTGVTTGMALTATYNGGEAVSFQWKKDGVNVGAASTTNPNTYTPTEAGSYAVTVSATGYNPKTSDPVTVTAPVPPSASISGSVTVTATKANTSGNGAVGADATVTINLSNATVNGALSADASECFSQTVAGLTYSASAADGATAITVTIEGIPTAVSTAAATISIPAGIIKNSAGEPTTAALAVSGNITYNIGEAAPNVAPTPAAAIDGSVTVMATRANTSGNGGAAANASVTINLSNATVNSALSAANASAWFTTQVAGLTYTANASAGASAITVTIAGTPTAVSTANSTISIPAGVVKNTEGTATAAPLEASGHITYNINQAVEELTGFTFTPLANLVIGSGANGTQAGATVGSFSAPVGGTAPYTYSLANGTGDTDNGLFQVSDTSLQVGSAALTAAKTYSVLVQVQDNSSPKKSFPKALTFTVNYPFAGTPGATISGNVTISGRVADSEGAGGSNVSSTISIALTNVKFKEDMAGGTDVSSWFSHTVAGLSYKLDDNGATTWRDWVYVEVSGTPTAVSTATTTITIPANLLNDSNGNPTITNNITVTGGIITYSIDRQPEYVVEVTASTISSITVGTKYYSIQELVSNLSTAGDITLTVLKDIELSSTVSMTEYSQRSVYLTIKAGSGTKTISRAEGFTGALFNITSGNLILGNGTNQSTPGAHTPTLIIDGMNQTANLVSMGSGTTAYGGLVVYNGVELRNASGSAVYLRGGATNRRVSFVMRGGVIAGCSVGVTAWDYADFTMTGGIIYGSSAGAPNANTTSIRVETDTTANVLGSTLAVGQYTQTYGTAP